MLQSILRLNDTAVEEVFTHRKNIFSINVDLDLKKIIEDINNSNFTRIPFWKNNQENIIGIFDKVLQSTIALAAFIPVIMGMGGNIGTQSSTIIVRGLATGRVSIENSMRILFKEIRVGLMLGILYGLLLGVVAIFQFIDVSPMLGIVVGLSICISMIIAATIGSLVPLILNRFEIDPAIATGPFVTTAIDILGVAFYFIVAGAFINAV